MREYHRKRKKSRLRKLLKRHSPKGLELLIYLQTEYYRVLARFGRRRCGTYVGITGSCGKSTATFLTGEMLKREGRTKAIVLNNLPRATLRSLAELKKPVKYMVQEISGHLPGAIAEVTPVAKPNIAVVLTVGHDHFSSFKHLVQKGEGGAVSADERYLDIIAAEKRQLVSGLQPGGIAVLNVDDPKVRAMASSAPGRVVFFGTGEDAEVRASNVSAVWPNRMSFDLTAGGVTRRVQTCFVGTLSLTSVLAALAVVHAVGGNLDRAIGKLATLEPLDERMSVHPAKDGHIYLADTRKAPHWQVERLLDDLPAIAAKPLVFVLGEISDTRNDKSGAYKKLLRRAAGLADHVIGFGPAASNAGKIAAQGYANVVGMDSHEQAVAFLATLSPGVVLLKSNKATRMVRIMQMAEGEESGKRGRKSRGKEPVAAQAV